MISAPGKLFVIGEYAVVYGGPAVLVPTPQLAEVQITQDNQDQLIISHGEDRTLRLSDAWIEEPLLNALITTLDCADQLATLSMTLDTSQFYYAGQKLGLGSSAALTGALVTALRPDLRVDERLSLATAAHQRFQGGRGSGADVALAVLGAPISFSKVEGPQAVELPQDLHMLAIWTGKPASTTNFLALVDRWKMKNADRFDGHMRLLTTCAADFVAATEATSMVNLIRQYNQYLHDFSKESGVNFYNDPHIALQKEVESARCAYKPSGAGGGDFGIAFSTDKDSITELAEQMIEAGKKAFLIR